MFSSINFWLATTAIAAIMVCYILLLFKIKPANESSDFSDFFELLQDNGKNLSVTRRRELLEKYKEERIKEYLHRKKRKPEDS